VALLGYRRVSRVGDRKDTLLSPDLQADVIEAYAAQRGIEVEMLDAELDVSGGRVRRPILEAALERVEAGTASGLIVDTLDRLSRMAIFEALGVIRRVEGAGGQVIAVSENFDAGTPEGRLVRNMFLSIGEMQRERYGGKIAASKRSAVERGIWPTGSCRSATG
jgi:site-specific DNA recombinase